MLRTAFAITRSWSASGSRPPQPHWPTRRTEIAAKPTPTAATTSRLMTRHIDRSSTATAMGSPVSLTRASPERAAAAQRAPIPSTGRPTARRMALGSGLLTWLAAGYTPRSPSYWIERWP
jgi:hypothetical protein